MFDVGYVNCWTNKGRADFGDKIPLWLPLSVALKCRRPPHGQYTQCGAAVMGMFCSRHALSRRSAAPESLECVWTAATESLEDITCWTKETTLKKRVSNFLYRSAIIHTCHDFNDPIQKQCNINVGNLMVECGYHTPSHFVTSVTESEILDMLHIDRTKWKCNYIGTCICCTFLNVYTYIFLYHAFRYNYLISRLHLPFTGKLSIYNPLIYQFNKILSGTEVTVMHA